MKWLRRCIGQLREWANDARSFFGSLGTAQRAVLYIAAATYTAQGVVLESFEGGGDWYLILLQPIMAAVVFYAGREIGIAIEQRRGFRRSNRYLVAHNEAYASLDRVRHSRSNVEHWVG